jgi:hypothetical protein
MELLRRALLVGCALPALWLLRLATLDPVVSVVALGPASPQQGASRSALIGTVSGPDWERFLRYVDVLENGETAPQDRWRLGADAAEDGGKARWVYFKADELPSRAILTGLAAGGGEGVVALPRPGGDLRYQLRQWNWTRQEFTPGSGFTGKPAPPNSLLYPFEYVAYACFFVGIALFALIPSPTRSRGGLSPGELGLLVAALALFAAPLLVTGGSVQALTRGLLVTIPCWTLSAIAIHLFAKPGLNAPRPLVERTGNGKGTAPAPDANVPAFLRWGVAMLAVAGGPLIVLVAVSMILWNR